MRIRQADNLSRVARIGEDFLISGEAGIENDFAAASRNRSRGAAMKNAPILERKNSLPCFRVRQWTLSLAGFKDYLRNRPTLLSFRAERGISLAFLARKPGRDSSVGSE